MVAGASSSISAAPPEPTYQQRWLEELLVSLLAHSTHLEQLPGTHLVIPAQRVCTASDLTDIQHVVGVPAICASTGQGAGFAQLPCFWSAQLCPALVCPPGHILRALCCRSSLLKRLLGAAEVHKGGQEGEHGEAVRQRQGPACMQECDKAVCQKKEGGKGRMRGSLECNQALPCWLHCQQQ